MPHQRLIAHRTPPHVQGVSLGLLCHRLRLMCAGLLVVLLSVGPVGGTLVAAEEPVGMADDACHYDEFADGRHDAMYVEWWYLNFFDARQGVQAIFTYLITDPGNLSGSGSAQLVAVAYTPQAIVSAIDAYAPDLFSASYERADVQIGANAIRVRDADTYQVVGASRDGRLAWDLLFVRQATPWFAADRMPAGRLPWEQASWLIYMPGAQVSGQVTVDGQVYEINALGYHDHNWGEWLAADTARWNWAQYFEPGLAFTMGDFIGRPEGAARIEFQGASTIFTKDHYQLQHTRWAFDPENRRWYPMQTTLRAENESWRLDLRLQTLATHPLRGDLLLRTFIVYEQTAQYEGQLWTKDAAGEWVLRVGFRGNGFKEYTAWSRRR